MALSKNNPFDTIENQLAEIYSFLLRNQKSATISETTTLNSEQYIDTKRVAEILEVSSVTIWDWEKKGLLQSYRIGNLKRFKLSEIMAAPKPIKRKGVNNGI